MIAPPAEGHAESLRVDLRLIADMIEPGARVLDVGCGDGALLDHLSRHMGVDARGIELSQAGVNACVSRGLSVIQGDADSDLGDYPAAAFDYVVLSRTLQATHKPVEVLRQVMRIGRRGVISFPNFGYWRVRWSLLVSGRMPMTEVLNEPWYETPNIHFCTIRDFVYLCRDRSIPIERALAVDHRGKPHFFTHLNVFDNLIGEQGVFVISGDAPG